MTEGLFKVQIKRLIQTFGDKAYPEPRVALLWDKVKFYNGTDFDKFISSCIMDCKFAPIGKEFNEFAQEQSKKIDEFKKEERLSRIMEGKTCGYCGDEGLILVTKKEDGSKWAFGCDECKTISDNPKILNYGDKENPKKIKLFDKYMRSNQLFTMHSLTNWSALDAIKRQERWAENE